MIFTKEDVVATKLTYDSGSGLITVDVLLRYFEDKVCFIKVNNDSHVYMQARPQMPCRLSIYTNKGSYNIDAKVKNTNFSLIEIVWELELSKQDSWQDIERRKGPRKRVKLPVKIRFYNDQELTLETEKLSESGFSCVLKEDFHPSLKKLPCDVYIDFSQYPNLGVENNLMQLKVKLVHVDNYKDCIIAGFKFVSIFPMQIEILRTL